jgi:hypothetical protein
MYESGNAISLFGGMFLFLWAFLYFYLAFMQYKIAKKVGHPSPWWAWIPIVNIFQQIQMARKEWYWFILCLVPVVNIFAFAAIWMNIARNCNKGTGWGILAIIPFLNFIAWAYLAFSSGEPNKAASPQPARQEHQHVG